MVSFRGVITSFQNACNVIIQGSNAMGPQDCDCNTMGQGFVIVQGSNAIGQGLEDIQGLNTPPAGTNGVVEEGSSKASLPIEPNNNEELKKSVKSPRKNAEEEFKPYEEDSSASSEDLTPLPKFSIIDQAVWERCFGAARLKEMGLSFENTPSFFGDREIRELASLCASDSADVKVTQMVIPKGLTVKKFLELMGHTFSLHNPFHPSMSRITLEGVKDLPVEQTRLIAITNFLVEGSVNKSLKEQKELLARSKCQMPRLLDALALGVLTRLNSPGKSYCVYGEKPQPVLTRCRELFKEEEKDNGEPSPFLPGDAVSIGRFCPNGIFDLVVGSPCPNQFDGVAAEREKTSS